MAENQLKYPWLNIVQFHKDFVQLEQENFFQIVLDSSGKPDPSKCLQITSLPPESIDGSWDVPQEQLADGPLREEILKGGLIEGYLGGPSWYGSQNANGKWDTYVSPLLYQHVRIEYDKEKHVIAFTPDEGRWDIPPAIYKQIEKHEFLLDIPFEELPFRIIEEAHLLCEKNDKSLSENIILAAVTRVPPIQDLFKNQNYRQKASIDNIVNPWIFFVAPSAEKSYVRYLMPDYDTLEKRLMANPSDIGGLSIFESPLLDNASEISEPRLYPIIPLNPSQEHAVSGILENKPITVISGPPGCGKSQVVVSLLLNAWAEGKSVLFVSNTKPAVDVVYDRLKEYECEYPLVVRAGAKDRNTIDSSLEKLKYLTSQKKSNPCQADQIRKQIADLTQNRKEYQQFLDDKIPQRITQAKQTASRSFLEFLAISKEIASNKEQYQERLNFIGYSKTDIEKFNDKIFLPLQRWWVGIEACKHQIKSDEQQRQEYSQKITLLERERTEILSRLGYRDQDISNFNWLISGPAPDQFEQWLNKYRTLLSDDIEQYYASTLSETHKKWESEADARVWLELSEDLLSRINHLIYTNREKYSLYNSLKSKYDSVKKEMLSANLQPDKNVDPTLLTRWKQEYAQFLTIPDGLLSVLKRKTSEANLQKIELGFHTYYPPEIWAEFSKDRKSARQKLSLLVDLTVRWVETQKEWENFGNDRDRIENECKNIDEIRKNLHLQKFIFNYSDEFSFLEITTQIKGLESTAREAAEKWCLYAKKEQFLTNIRTLALQFDMFTMNSPIVKVWTDGQGMDFSHIIQGLKNQPTFEMIAKSWNYCSVDHTANFIDQWKKCQKLQTDIVEYTEYYKNVPQEKTRISEWWASKPCYCAISRLDQSTLPSEGDVLSCHLQDCKKLCEDWQKNIETVVRIKNKERKDHFTRAIQNLAISYNNIPLSMRDDKIDAVFRPILTQLIDDGHWLTEDDESAFDQFNPERIHARINQINSRLSDYSFSLVKEDYLKRITEGSYILEDVDALRSHLKKQYSNARGFPKNKYQNALKAVPIWVTNAHQPQSFPMEPELFDILVIDEASQCSLTNILPFIYRAKSLAVIGDPNQLSAIFKDTSKGKEQTIAAKHKMSDFLEFFGHINNTLFDLGLKFLPGGRKNMINLVEHYRSHPLIIGFSNLYIYQMRLSLRKETRKEIRRSNIAGVFGLDIVGECSRGYKGKSWMNVKEATLVCEVVRDIQKNEDFMGKSIGIVTPFASQKEKIMDIFLEQGSSSKDILVGTVDTFQGNERDIMIFSPVISKNIPPNTACWSDDKNRINVALTRAKELMIVVGDFNYCRKMDVILGRLIDYVETITLLRQTSLAELELYSLLIMEGSGLGINMSNLPKIHQRIGRIEVDFVLHNAEKGVNLVVEVDGKQHYYVEIGGNKYSVKYNGLNRYIELNGQKYYFHPVGNREFVTLNEKNYSVTQTTESIQDDKGRDAFLRSEGYKVLRILANDIFEKPAVVISDIKQKMEIDETAA
jgi:very-short-patch-repair endonuclease